MLKQTTKGAIFIALSFTIAITVFVVLLDTIGLSNVLEILLRVRAWHIAVIVGFALVQMTLFNVRWRRVLRTGGYRISIKDLFFYRLAGHAVSYFTPAADFGGEPVMAYLLNKEHGEIGFTKSFASVVINRMIGLVVNIIFILLAFLYVFTFFVLPEELAFAFYVVAGLIVVLLVMIYFLITKKPLERIMRATGLYRIKALRRFVKVEEFDYYLNDFFHEHPKDFLINLGLSVLSTLSLVGGFWSLAYLLSFDMNFFEALTTWSIDSIVSSMPVPANIGLAEMGESVWFGIMGFGAASGFSFYIVYRSKDILFSLLGLVSFIYKGLGKEIIGLIQETFKINNTDKSA